jgi:NAD(P)-dependent dehydrogenase (short-subunit alcohol dehydrogenase family)
VNELRGRVAVVTGGSRGVGAAIVGALAEAGAHVVAVSRSEAAVTGARHVRADVTDARGIEDALRGVEEEVGPIALLVNNAGTAAAIGPAWLVDPKDWWGDVESSLGGSFLCSRAVIPAMRERQAGRIVNIASHAGTRPSPYLSGYAAAKAALLNFTESLAAELADDGIRVFAVSPGRVRTALTEPMVSGAEGRRWLPQLQSGRWLEPELGARLVAQLASGRGDALSGRFLHALDDLDALVARAGEIAEHDLYVPRLRTS